MAAAENDAHTPQHPSRTDGAQLHGGAAGPAPAEALGFAWVGSAQTGDTLSTAEVLLRGLHTGRVNSLPAASIPLHLLIVEDDAALAAPLAEAGRAMGFTVDSATLQDMQQASGGRECDVILLDLRRRTEGLQLLQRLRYEFPRVPILVTTSLAAVQTAAEALRLGATDFLTEPYSLEELSTTLHLSAEQRSFDVELRRLQHQMRTSPALQQMAAASPAMQKLISMVTRVSLSQHPLLVLGESGTGKERLVRMLHNASEAAHQAQNPSHTEPLPFLHVLCSSPSTAVVESDLFGFVRSEGTAARDEHVGCLTVDGGGTLFLDEVDALTLEVQAKLLRALQDRSIRPPGSALQRPVTVRVVAGSSRDLPALVERGAFRKDLYFRLNVVTLRVPPLRQRREDIPLLAAGFLERHSRERHLDFSLGAGAIRALLEYPWPGNVRELESVIERACSLSSGPVLHPADLSSQLRPYESSEQAVHIDARPAAARPTTGTISGPIEPIAELERRAILSTLEQLNGDKLKAAKMLGIGKTTLYRKLKEYDIA